jgi:adenine-specific DNA-methyltransferase
MGAYFSVRAQRPPSLFSEPMGQESSAKETLRAGKLVARDIAAPFDGEEREAVARTLTSAIVSVYWERIQERTQAPLPLRDSFIPQQMIQLPAAAYALATSMGEAASTLDPLAAAYLISVTYTVMLPDNVRSRFGAYYTPPPLAERLVAMATRAGVNWASCRILDPACGSVSGHGFSRAEEVRA